MSISSIETGSSSAYFGVTAAKQKGQLDMEAFLRLLVTQLENQNPLEPMNDRDFFAQMAQLGTVQGLEGLQDSVNVQQANQLMGKIATATRSENGSQGGGSTITGLVQKVVIRNGEQYVGIQDANGSLVEVKTSQILNVQSASTVSDGAALIGRNVSGTAITQTNGSASYKAVTGQVVGVQLTSQGTVLQVKDESGQVSLMPISSLSAVSL